MLYTLVNANGHYYAGTDVVDGRVVPYYHPTELVLFRLASANHMAQLYGLTIKSVEIKDYVPGND